MIKGASMTSLMQELEGYLSYSDVVNPKVSKVQVAWHLDHSLKVINAVCDALSASDPNLYKKQFSGNRWICFTFNYIPRGIGRAPRSVRPPDNISTNEILEQLQLAKHKIVSLDTLDDRANFNHPYFKILNRDQSKRFLKLHTQHHLKIIRDILGK